MQTFTAGIFITAAFFLTGATSFVFSLFSSFTLVDFDEPFVYDPTVPAPPPKRHLVGDRPDQPQRRSINDHMPNNRQYRPNPQRPPQQPHHPQQLPQRRSINAHVQQPQRRQPQQRPPQHRQPQQKRPQQRPAPQVRRPVQRPQPQPQQPLQQPQRRPDPNNRNRRR